MVYYIPKLEKDTSIKTGYGNTLSNPGTVSLKNNVTLSNLTQKNTNTTTLNKPNYYVLKGMQNGTINKNNLMSYMTPAQNTQYTVKPNITEMLENSYDYLEQKYKQSDDYRLVQQDKKFVDKHPQAMTEEGWIDRQRALNAGNTELAKQIEEQDKAKRTQNWNDWWNSEAEVKKRQERTDKYNKEQKEYDARIPESIKKIQKFADETKNDIAMQGAREYVKELTQTMGENEIADYLDNYLYIQGFASGTKSGWWSDYSAYDDLKEDLKALIEENGGVVDIENASKLAKYIKDATGYELPADGVGETLWRGAKSLGKNTAKGITKVGDSVFTGWSMAYTAGKNAITGSNDKYRQYNSWDNLNAELNGEIYRKEYKDPSLQNAWSNALSGGAGLAQVAQTVYFPVINYVFDTAGETQTGRDLFSNKYAGTAIGAVIGAVATKGKWTGIGAGAGIGSVPTLVDSAVEEYAGNMSEEDKENLKGLITDGFFTALGVKETGNNYKPIQSKVQTVKNTAEAIKNVPKTVETIKDSRAVKQATKGTEQATVSKEYDPTRVANANKNIDTRKIKTYEQWGNALKDRVTKASREVDSMLSKDKVYNLNDFNQKTTSGKTEVNYVKNALEDMKKFYEKNRSYEKLEKIEDILSGKEKLSELDVNNLAREYGIEFDAWLKNGELSSSANKQGYETTRMGIKQWLRENTEGGKKAETLDREISDIKNLEKIVDRRTKNVTSEEIRGKESVLGKVVRGATTVAGTAVGTALAPGYGSIGGVIVGKVIGNILTNVGKKQGKSDLDMQKSLNKNLKKIQKLSERLKKKEITEKQVEREIEDLLSSEKQRSKFLKKKTKTEAKKLSEPKVKGLLTEGKKALPEGKKLLKSGEKTENKAKSETKPLKKSEEKVEKKTENVGEKSKAKPLKNKSNEDYSNMDYIEVEHKISEIKKEIRDEIDTEYSKLTKEFRELVDSDIEGKGEKLKNLQDKMSYLSENRKKIIEEELKTRVPKELLNREKELEDILEEKTKKILSGEFDEQLKRWIESRTESNLLKKPKKLEAKKLKTPKKESEVSELYKKFEDNKLKTKEEYVDLYVENAIRKGDIEFSDAKMIDAFKKQLLKTSTKAYLENSLKKDFGKDYKTDAGTKVPKGEGKATDRIKEHYKSKFKFVDKVPKGYEKIYTEGIRKIDGFDAYGKLEPVRGNPDLKTIDYSSIVYKEAEVKPLKKKGKSLKNNGKKYFTEEITEKDLLNNFTKNDIDYLVGLTKQTGKIKDTSISARMHNNFSLFSREGLVEFREGMAKMKKYLENFIGEQKGKGKGIDYNEKLEISKKSTEKYYDKEHLDKLIEQTKKNDEPPTLKELKAGFKKIEDIDDVRLRTLEDIIYKKAGYDWKVVGLKTLYRENMRNAVGKISISDVAKKRDFSSDYNKAKEQNYYVKDFEIVEKLKSDPESEITIYRGMPREEWNYGDWIALTPEYASRFGKVFSKKVKAKELKLALDEKYNGLNRFIEYVYQPEGEVAPKRGNKYFKNMTDEFRSRYKNISTEGFEKISNEQASKIIDNIFKGEVKTEFVDNIKTPEGFKALGEYGDALIKFVNEPKKNVVYHEALHAYFDLSLGKARKSELLKQIKNEQKFKDNLSAEEWLADKFSEFAIGREIKGVSSGIKKVISDLWYELKKLFGGEVNKVDELFREIEKVSKSKSGAKVLKKGKPLKVNKYFLAGTEARGLVSEKIREAREMKKAGKSADEIWKKTGFEEGKDGKWRFEIDASKTRTKQISSKKFEGREFVLSDIFENKELFKNYPELRNIEVGVSKLDGPLGEFHIKENKILLEEDLFDWDRTVKKLEDIKELEKIRDEKRILDEEFEKKVNEVAKKGGDKYEIRAEVWEKYFSEKMDKLVEKENNIFNNTEIEYFLTKEGKSVLSHEIQHWIQEKEKFRRQKSKNSYQQKF